MVICTPKHPKTNSANQDQLLQAHTKEKSKKAKKKNYSKLPLESTALAIFIRRISIAGFSFFSPKRPNNLHMLFLVLILSLSVVSLANTEAYGFQIPNYYDIPIHNPKSSLDTTFHVLNETALLLKNHPILSIDNYTTENSVLSVPYNFTISPKQRLYVKLNNYHNHSFDSKDLINVKLCWPATTPVNFKLSHRFIQEKQFTGLGHKSNTLDIYIVIDYEADFYAMDPVQYTDFEILLAVSKLPNKLPIPIELYDVLVYVVDILILVATVLPWLLESFHKIIAPV